VTRCVALKDTNTQEIHFSVRKFTSLEKKQKKKAKLEKQSYSVNERNYWNKSWY